MSIPVPQEALTGLTWPGDGLTTLLPGDELLLHTGNQMKLRVKRGNQTLQWLVTGREDLSLGELRTPETRDRWMREIAEHYNLDAVLQRRRTLFSVYDLRSRPSRVALP